MASSSSSLSSAAKRRGRAKAKNVVTNCPEITSRPEIKEFNRQQREELSVETRKICAAEFYINSKGEKVKLTDMIEACKKTSILYRDTKLLPRSDYFDDGIYRAPRIEVTSESTIEACLRLAKGDKNLTIIAQNFASATNPGGGFLTGAKAQEESLCYASALYNILSSERMSKYYEENKKIGGYNFYGDSKIWVPNCPVFRDHHANLLDAPVPVSFVSCPAVNRNSVPRGSSTSPGVVEWEKKALVKMNERVRDVLRIAGAYHSDKKSAGKALVLGAFGCGVFKNDPKEVAKIYSKVLHEPEFKNAFDVIVFAIYDPTGTGSTLNDFKRELHSLIPPKIEEKKITTPQVLEEKKIKVEKSWDDVFDKNVYLGSSKLTECKKIAVSHQPMTRDEWVRSILQDKLNGFAHSRHSSSSSSDAVGGGLILFMSASFNPIHRKHLDLMKQGKIYVEEKLGRKVIAGIISVSSDQHVKTKSHGYLPLSHRVEMCKIAVAEEKLDSWLHVCGWGEASGPKVQKQIRAALSDSKKFAFVEVGGLDFVVGRKKYAHIPEGDLLLCFSRPLSDESTVSEQLKVARKVASRQKNFHLLEPSTKDVDSLDTTSSTEIRKLLHGKIDKNSEEKLNLFLHTGVLEYLENTCVMSYS